MDQETKDVLKVIGTVLFVVIACVGLGLWGCPTYNVYSQEMSGRAKLAEAPLRKALEARPDRANGYRHLAMMLWSEGRIEEAARPRGR